MEPIENNSTLKEAEICTDYDEVCKSEQFQIFMNSVLKDFCQNVLNGDIQKLGKVARVAGIPAQLDIIEEEKEKVLCIIKNYGSEIFASIRGKKPIGGLSRKFLDLLLEDEDFLRVAETKFNEIDTYRGKGIAGKQKFIEMFTKKTQEGLSIDFSDFQKYLSNKIMLNNIHDFSERVKEITDIGISETSEYGTHEILFRGKRYSLVSYRIKVSEKHSPVGMRYVLIFDNLNNTFVKEYSGISISDPDHLNPILKIDSEDIKLLQLGMFKFKKMTDSGLRYVLLDLETGEEVIYFDSCLDIVEVDGVLYLPLNSGSSAMIFDLSKRYIMKEEDGFYVKEFDTPDTKNNGYVTFASSTPDGSKLYSIRLKTFVLERYQKIRHLCRLKDGSSVFSVHGFNMYISVLFKEGYGVYKSRQFSMILSAKMRDDDILEIKVVPQDSILFDLGLKKQIDPVTIYLNLDSGVFYRSYSKALREATTYSDRKKRQSS